MAVGVCVSAKKPPCNGCRYGYPKDTGDAVREPSRDTVAGEGVREITGLIDFAKGLTSSISGEFSCGVEALDDNDGVATFSGSCVGSGNPPTRPGSPLAGGPVDLVDPNCSQH